MLSHADASKFSETKKILVLFLIVTRKIFSLITRGRKEKRPLRKGNGR